MCRWAGLSVKVCCSLNIDNATVRAMSDEQNPDEQGQDEEKTKEERKQTRLGCGIALALVVAAVAATVLLVGGRDGEDETVSLSASAQTDGRGYVYVTNNDMFDWSGVKLALNENYVHRLDVLSAGERIALPIAEFILDDGTRFNPATTKVLQLTITACAPVAGEGDTVLCSAGYQWGYTKLVWD